MRAFWALSMCCGMAALFTWIGSAVTASAVQGARLSINFRSRPAVLHSFMEGTRGWRGARASWLASFSSLPRRGREHACSRKRQLPGLRLTDFNARITELLATKATTNDDGSLRRRSWTFPARPRRHGSRVMIKSRRRSGRSASLSTFTTLRPRPPTTSPAWPRSSTSWTRETATETSARRRSDQLRRWWSGTSYEAKRFLGPLSSSPRRPERRHWKAGCSTFAAARASRASPPGRCSSSAPSGTEGAGRSPDHPGGARSGQSGG